MSRNIDTPTVHRLMSKHPRPWYHLPESPRVVTDAEGDVVANLKDFESAIQLIEFVQAMEGAK